MKKITIIVLLFFAEESFCQKLFSGTFSILSGYYSLSKNIIQKKDGGFIFTLSFPFYDQTRIVSIDSSGNYLWEKSYTDTIVSNNGHFDIGGIVQTADNGFLLAGTHDSTYIWGTNPAYEYLLVKIDSMGSVSWAKTFSRAGSNSNQYFISIVPTPQQGFLVTSFGLQVNTDSLGNIIWIHLGGFGTNTTLLSSSEYLSVWSNRVSKLDSLCNTIYSFNVNPPGNKSLTITNAIETLDHNYAFAGIEDSASQGAISFFITDTSGNILTASHTAFPSITYNDIFPSCLIQLSDSQFTLVAATVQGGSVSWRLFIIDNNGQLIESKEVMNSVYFSAQTSAVKCFAGDKYAVLLFEQMPWGSTKSSVILIDRNDSTWCGTQPIPVIWYSDSLSVNYISGHSYGVWPINQGAIPITANTIFGSGNFICNPFAEIDDYPLDEEYFILGPNPITYLLKIKSSHKIEHIDLFNLLGEKVPASIDTRLRTVDCSLLPPGIYILQASGEGKVWRGKVVKE